MRKKKITFAPKANLKAAVMTPLAETAEKEQPWLFPLLAKKGEARLSQGVVAEPVAMVAQ